MNDPSMLLAHDWNFPVPIAYGPGRLAEMGQRCVALGVRNPLIVTDRGSRELSFVTRLVDVLSDGRSRTNKHHGARWYARGFVFGRNFVSQRAWLRACDLAHGWCRVQHSPWQHQCNSASSNLAFQFAWDGRESASHG